MQWIWGALICRRLRKLSECFRKTTLAASGGRERGEGERRLARKLWNRLREVVVTRAKTRALGTDLKTHLTA